MRFQSGHIPRLQVQSPVRVCVGCTKLMCLFLSLSLSLLLSLKSINIYKKNYSHPSGCEVIPYCGFRLLFLNDYRCWASFHVQAVHFYVSFGNISIQILCSFIKLDYFSCPVRLILLEHHLMDGKVVSLIPAQGALGEGNQLMFLSHTIVLSFFPHPDPTFLSL